MAMCEHHKRGTSTSKMWTITSSNPITRPGLYREQDGGLYNFKHRLKCWGQQHLEREWKKKGWLFCEPA
jgi:hypothetical protein